MLKTLLRRFFWSTLKEPEPSTFAEQKANKLARIRSLLRDDIPFVETPLHYNFLTEELRQQFNIIDTENVSSNPYDPYALHLIESTRDGFILDCGAGSRSVYYDNVVNFEVCPYQSTDVLGVGESLPFRDESFAAVFSLAVLEHVKNPFLCAREIIRVMRPGAVLYCVVPFLQQLHAFPHHYYNMTQQGLRNLFEPYLTIEKQEILASGLPIWNLSAILQRWTNSLAGDTKEQFLNMKVQDLIGNPIDYLSRPFVAELPVECNFELATTTALFAKKPSKAGQSS
jgi:SAM-dependent methyltransferase